MRDLVDTTRTRPPDWARVLRRWRRFRRASWTWLARAHRGLRARQARCYFDRAERARDEAARENLRNSLLEAARFRW